jgi:RNA polymerase sigma-70 factor (ECF subfamily)
MRTNAGYAQLGRHRADPATRLPRPATGHTLPDSWQLIERIQHGDVEAFGEFYDRYNAEVYKYLWLRCGRVQLAQDLVGDVWHRALKGIGSLRSHGTSPLCWLLTLARDRAMDHFQSRFYHLEVIDGDGRDLPETADVAEESVTPAQSAQLLAAIRMLPPAQQEAIALTFLCGLTSAEAAHVMGKSTSMVNALTKAGRYELVKLLAPGTPA